MQGYKKKKPTYETPVVLPLGDLAVGQGQCTNGSGAVTNSDCSCSSGTEARSDPPFGAWPDCCTGNAAEGFEFPPCEAGTLPFLPP